ncbi:MAG TPA: hypothetical protein VN766_13265 [Stellaceae bacterium]|nr:hypothetical protein [Stellaceae bacterium]
MSNNPEFDFFRRMGELRAEGLSHHDAFERSNLEQRAEIALRQSKTHLIVWLFGALDLKRRYDFPEFGLVITGDVDKNPGHIFRVGTAYKAEVALRSADIAGLLEAIERVERFIAAWHLVSGGGDIHYFSAFMHGMSLGAAGVNLDADEALLSSFDSVVRALPERARSLVDRAASWFRQGKTGYFAGGWRSSIFAEYAAAWNAFECLVGAICSLNPPRGTNRTEKQQLINDYLASIGRPPTLQDIDFCYSRIVNPGLRHETTHALRLIFGATADQYLAELFSATPQENSLYNIRNDINHANINETKFEDWLRVGRGYARLSLIVRQLLRIAGALPVILDPWIRSCFTCEHKKETDCALGLRPASEQYWKFACDRHTWGKGFPAV